MAITEVGPTLIRRAFDWLPLTGAGEMSDYSDGQSVCLTESRVFAGATVSRVFVGDTVSRAYMDAALQAARRRVAELSNETISRSDMVGGEPDGRRGAKRGGVSPRSSTPGSDEANRGKAPGLDALAL
jgi:hypothetical protein